MGAYHRAAAPEHGIAPDRVRLGFAVVWLATVAVRGVLAVPDSRAAAGEVGLPGDQGSRQAENHRPQLRAPVPRLLHDPEEVRVNNPRLGE